MREVWVIEESPSRENRLTRASILGRERVS